MSSLFVTSSRESKLLKIDSDTLEIEDFRIVDRPRGMCLTVSGELVIAGWADVSCWNAENLTECEGYNLGAHNHDVFTQDGKTYVVCLAARKPLPIDATSSSLEYTEIDFSSKFINTAKSSETFTTLTRRSGRDRGYEGDSVIYKGLSYDPIEAEHWNRPHHILELSNGAVWVCDSGTGRIVDIKNKYTVHTFESYFPRGLFERDNKVFITLTGRRNSDDSETKVGVLNIDGTLNKLSAPFSSSRDLYQVFGV
jgi:hypothetical protein